MHVHQNPAAFLVTHFHRHVLIGLQCTQDLCTRHADLAVLGNGWKKWCILALMIECIRRSVKKKSAKTNHYQTWDKQSLSLEWIEVSKVQSLQGNICRDLWNDNLYPRFDTSRHPVGISKENPMGKSYLTKFVRSMNISRCENYYGQYQKM